MPLRPRLSSPPPPQYPTAPKSFPFFPQRVNIQHAATAANSFLSCVYFTVLWTPRGWGHAESRSPPKTLTGTSLATRRPKSDTICAPQKRTRSGTARIGIAGMYAGGYRETFEARTFDGRQRGIGGDGFWLGQ